MTGLPWLGAIRQLHVVSEQACALLRMFWKSGRLIVIHVKDQMCHEGGFGISRCAICMWMEPFSAFVLTVMQRAPSPLNLEDICVVQIKVIPINGWGVERWSVLTEHHTRAATAKGLIKDPFGVSSRRNCMKWPTECWRPSVNATVLQTLIS